MLTNDVYTGKKLIDLTIWLMSQTKICKKKNEREANKRNDNVNIKSFLRRKRSTFVDRAATATVG